MNRTLTLATALSAALFTAPLAQAQAAPAPAAPAAPVVPQAVDAKIALIAFEQAVFATNEGQVTAQAVQKKYEPQKTRIESLGAEVDSLKKQLQAAPATLSDEERNSRLRAIDIKEKALNSEAENATTAYNSDLQEALSKVAQKLTVTMRQYVQSSGFTLLLDVSNQQSAVMWALPSTEITQAVVDAYNKSSGVAAPTPSAPSATRPRPAATKPPATK